MSNDFQKRTLIAESAAEVITPAELTLQVEERLLKRNHLGEELFSREAYRLAEACRSMSERFLAGGRLLAFGRGWNRADPSHI